MAYIQPDTTIELYKNVPLDKSYRNTVKYSDSITQYNDFKQYKYKSYEKQSYQRWGLGTIRIEEQHDNIYDCNYMIFYNPTLKKKIYCFVDGVSYVSNNVTEVYYTIDVLQTYMFEYTLGKCFVEREHVYRDIQGENTQPEGLELGDCYIYDYAGMSGLDSYIPEWHYIILATAYPSGAPFNTPTIRNGILNGLYYYDTTSTNNISTILKQYIDQGLEDAIVSLYMAPADSTSGTATALLKRDNIGGFTPKNKKLLTYPYCFLQVSNNLGNTLELHYENMGTLTHSDSQGTRRQYQFNVRRFSFPQPIMLYIPSYNNIGLNYDYMLTYSVFPTCAFAGDSFKVWWAQNKNTYIATMNAIQSNYDTNMAVANNNFQQAVNSAQATKQATLNSISNGLTTATMQRNVAKRQASNNYDVATKNLSGAISQGVTDATSGLIGWLRSTGGGNDPSGNLSKRANTENLNNAGTMLTNTLNSTNVNAQNTLNNANLSADLGYQVANATASTNTQNAELAHSTAMKNATLSQSSANLTALTTAQNATAQLVAKKQDAMHQPPTVHGQSSCDGVNVALGHVGFMVQGRCIKQEYSRKIDDYFTMYGYAVNELKYPNLNNRKYYTYLKTANCNLNSKRVDAQTRQTIEGIYNNGITTWKELSQVGNYDLDNAPNGDQY